MTRRHDRAFKLIAGLIVCVSIFLLDFLVGYVKDTSIFRTVTFTFKTEVAPLNTTTLHLLPKLDDSYPQEDPHQEGPRRVRTDKYGLLVGPDYGVSPNASEKILFLGGSTTENNEVDEEFRFPYLAAKIATETSGRPYYGVNGGVRGHTSQNSINLYLNHPSPLIEEAEKVVVMHNINDRLRLAIFNGYKSNIEDPPQISLRYSSNQISGLALSFWKWLSFHSNILYLIDVTMQRIFSDKSLPAAVINERTLDSNPEVNKLHLDLFKENLKTLIAIIRSKNKTPYLMTQPLGKVSKGQNEFNAAVRQLAASEGVRLIDLAALIDKHPQSDKLFFPDGIHFNNDGSSIAAKYIASELLASEKRIAYGR